MYIKHTITLITPCALADLGLYDDIYIFIASALDESIFLDVLHFPMKNILVA